MFIPTNTQVDIKDRFKDIKTNSQVHKPDVQISLQVYTHTVYIQIYCRLQKAEIYNVNIARGLDEEARCKNMRINMQIYIEGRQMYTVDIKTVYLLDQGGRCILLNRFQYRQATR